MKFQVEHLNQIKNAFKDEVLNNSGIYNVDQAFANYFSCALKNPDSVDHLSKSVVILVFFFTILLSEYISLLSNNLVNCAVFQFGCGTRGFWKRREWEAQLLCVPLLPPLC